MHKIAGQQFKKGLVFIQDMIESFFAKENKPRSKCFPIEEIIAQSVKNVSFFSSVGIKRLSTAGRPSFALQHPQGGGLALPTGSESGTLYIRFYCQRNVQRRCVRRGVQRYLANKMPFI